MLRIYYKKDKRLAKESDISLLRTIPLNDMVWVDLQNSTVEEKVTIETYFDIKYSSVEESSEIESSSRFNELDDELIINSNFLSLKQQDFDYCPVSIILEKGILFTYRDDDLKTFGESVKKIKSNPGSFTNGYHILLTILETGIEQDADIIEGLAKDIADLNKKLTLNRKRSDEEILLKIASFQNYNILMRENIVDKQRLVSSLMKSSLFPEEYMPVLRIMIKDIGSLIEHNKFAFERLEYLQDTFMGLVNIEQNRIIKIFTVATVAFMPPTLIASVYGMNFKIMPELDWDYGYVFAISLMVLSSVLTLIFFKKKNWL
ncbi:MAG: magnesium and cobalt transport protein CorA [Sphingobacteriales bacterium 17-39-43]|uniref:magnesium/cobalt transporter CorA n=1 Tax=Daejeonella sp. TaxID=2805397 RepID=UPI000BCF2A62|nr:magnesium/cobalt transporter CorA [Daejeonella sp.]OYZ28114.1 MAG: magnesium and cobalt transport protein CorA [Sphingobacteriales bacterium 16-39-50]OZA22011.1 MAG: magnesium and cobalt transport protein CorA [Sphingobacteriales bacterium 17-39-43]HQT24898.1 magnesium/cobalt transporter CorA [Daejeonella sp.]HQT59501.1 magnesium/cobalt transporter CorA [Daejeonella sp.]